jgi:hypothetical protein
MQSGPKLLPTLPQKGLGWANNSAEGARSSLGGGCEARYNTPPGAVTVVFHWQWHCWGDACQSLGGVWDHNGHWRCKHSTAQHSIAQRGGGGGWGYILNPPFPPSASHAAAAAASCNGRSLSHHGAIQSREWGRSTCLLAISSLLLSMLLRSAGHGRHNVTGWARAQTGRGGGRAWREASGRWTSKAWGRDVRSLPA